MGGLNFCGYSVSDFSIRTWEPRMRRRPPATGNPKTKKLVQGVGSKPASSKNSGLNRGNGSGRAWVDAANPDETERVTKRAIYGGFGVCAVARRLEIVFAIYSHHSVNYTRN